MLHACTDCKKNLKHKRVLVTLYAQSHKTHGTKRQFSIKIQNSFILFTCGHTQLQTELKYGIYHHMQIKKIQKNNNKKTTAKQSKCQDPHSFWCRTLWEIEGNKLRRSSKCHTEVHKRIKSNARLCCRGTKPYMNTWTQTEIKALTYGVFKFCFILLWETFVQLMQHVAFISFVFFFLHSSW